MVTTGGTSLRDDIVRLQQNINVIVATPGRMLDLVEKGIADLSICEYVAMDEVGLSSWQWLSQFLLRSHSIRLTNCFALNSKKLLKS